MPAFRYRSTKLTNPFYTTASTTDLLADGQQAFVFRCKLLPQLTTLDSRGCRSKRAKTSQTAPASFGYRRQFVAIFADGRHDDPGLKSDSSPYTKFIAYGL
jgi:hypothetical protein